MEHTKYCFIFVETKKNNMNQEVMKSIITDTILEKMTQVIEEMSTNEFVDMIIDTYYTETGVNLEDEFDEDTDVREVVVEMIGDKVFPLLTTIQNYVLEHIVKK